VTPAWVFGAIMKGLEAPPYSRVRAPALAFYALYESPGAVLSPKWWASLDATGRRETRATLHQMAARSRIARERFHAAVHSGTVIELPAANHFVWVTNRDQVVSGMRRFLEAR
jgi:hypothetical protein